MIERTFQLKAPLDLRQTCGLHRRGSGDPTMRLTRDELWRASRTPAGPGSVHVGAVAGEIRASAWGPGAEWLLAAVPDYLGLDDEPHGLVPRHPLVASLKRSLAGLRIGRTRAVVEALIPAVLKQKVIGREAWLSYARLVAAWSEPAPGPESLLLPPDPSMLAARAYFEFHAFGIERKRADVLRSVCRSESRLEALTAASSLERTRFLTSFRGIGPWTVAEVAARAWGDADAVSIGDYHLPHLVAWSLGGRARGDNQLMLELLEPYRGQRGRVVRLLEAGAPRPPRFGPRARLRSIARM